MIDGTIATVRTRLRDLRTWLAVRRDRTPGRAERETWTVRCVRCATSFRPALTDAACPVCGCTDDVPTWGQRRRVDTETRALGLVVGATVANLLLLAVVALLLLG